MRSKRLAGILIIIRVATLCSCNKDQSKADRLNIMISKQLLTEEKETGKVEIMISVINLGDNLVRDIQLKEKFDSPDIEAIGPKENFIKADSLGRQTGIEWNHSIPTIRPKQTIATTYELRVHAPVTLDKTLVLQNDSLVAASNPINLFAEANLPSANALGFQAVAVVPVEWWFEFVGKEDREIYTYFLSNLGGSHYNYSTQELAWSTQVQLWDNNSDALFHWYLKYGVLGLNSSFMQYGASGELKKNGAASSRHEDSFISASLQGYDAATIVLAGWGFCFEKDDHEISSIGIQLQDIFYDPVLGKISWKAEASLADRYLDDNYTWNYEWLIIALKNGTIRTLAANSGINASGGWNYAPLEVKDGGYKNLALLPQGWRFEYVNHDVREIYKQVFRIGKPYLVDDVPWAVETWFHDKNFGDAYRFYANVAEISFNDGAYVVIPDPVLHIADIWGYFKYKENTNTIFPRLVANVKDESN